MKTHISCTLYTSTFKYKLLSYFNDSYPFIPRYPVVD